MQGPPHHAADPLRDCHVQLPQLSIQLQILTSKTAASGHPGLPFNYHLHLTMQIFG